MTTEEEEAARKQAEADSKARCAERKAMLKEGDPAEAARHAGAYILLDASTEADRAGDAKRAAHLLALGKGLGYALQAKRVGGGFFRKIAMCDPDPALEREALAEVGKAATAQAPKPKAGGQRVAIGRVKA